MVDRWYRQNYGRVKPPRETQVKDAVWTVFGVAALIGLTVLDSIFDLPVNGYVLAYALVIFGYIATSIGVKLRHAVVWGTLLVAGLLDHAVFVANLGPSRLSAENGNVGV